MIRLASMIAVIILVAHCSPAAGQIDSTATEPTTAQDPRDEADDDKSHFAVHFQIGYLHRFATNISNEVRQPYLITGDLSFLRLSRTRSSWGFGLHFAYDDYDHRLGVKGIWRTPLKKGTWMYLQLAPGIYVSSTNDVYDTRLPGFFVEVEMGLAREFALVLAGEVMPYEGRRLPWDPVRYWNDQSQPTDDGTAIALFAGAKVGQAGAIAAAAIGAIVGIVVLASIASSGGVM